MLTRRFGFGLSCELWVVQIGIFLNMFGYGAVLPFEVIYLHDARGLSLGTAGLIVGALSIFAVATAPFAGPIIDRFGARAAAAAGGLALAAGYGGLALATGARAAFAAAALAGLGNGLLNPSQSTLIATLAPRNLRHRATAVSRVATNAGIGLGGALGGLAAAQGLNGFVALFLANAVTYVIYVAVLLALVADSPRQQPLRGGYSQVLHDRAFRHLSLVNVAMVAVGWGVFTWLMPPFAVEQLGVGTGLIGFVLLANAATVVVAQVPIAHFTEGRRRVAMMAAAAALFVFACVLLVAADLFGAAVIALVVASVAVALGECFYTSVLSPLVADLAPAALRGRYMAVTGLTWWIGLGLAPSAGTQLLGTAPAGALLAAAALAVIAGAASLALDRKLAAEMRRTPYAAPVA